MNNHENSNSDLIRSLNKLKNIKAPEKLLERVDLMLGIENFRTNISRLRLNWIAFASLVLSVLTGSTTIVASQRSPGIKLSPIKILVDGINYNTDDQKITNNDQVIRNENILNNDNPNDANSEIDNDDLDENAIINENSSITPTVSPGTKPVNVSNNLENKLPEPARSAVEGATQTIHEIIPEPGPQNKENGQNEAKYDINKVLEVELENINIKLPF